MLELLDFESPRVIGVRILGKIDKADVDRIVAAGLEKFKLGEKLRVYVEVEDFGGISLEALIEDIKFALPNISKFEKKAVVSNKDWHVKAVEISNKWFPSLEVRHFSPEQKEEARTWVQS